MDFERINWINRIPEDVWIILLDYLPDYKSIINFAIASPYFGTLLLQNRKEVYLFPEICYIVNQTTAANFDRTTTTFETLVSNYCRNFTRHQDLPLRQFQSANQGQPNSEKDICNLYNFSIQDLNNILVEVQNNRGFYITNNPFPSKHIALVEPHTISDISLIPAFRLNTREILEHLGHHFWHASIGIGFQNSDVVPSSEFNERLKTCLRHLRYLRSLEVSSPNAGTDIVVLQRNISRIKTLRVLSVERGAALAALRPLHEDVQKFGIFEPEGRNERDQGDKLESFHLMDLEPQKFAINLKSTGDLDVLSNQWNLTFLQILCPDGLFWGNINQKLGFFKSSLVELHLQLPWTTDKDLSVDAFNNSKVSLELPHLKHLRVIMPHYYSLDFVLGLESLECLWVQINFSVEHNIDNQTLANTRIQFNANNLAGFLNSNIWQLVPSLKAVCVEAKGTTTTVNTFFREQIQTNQ